VLGVVDFLERCFFTCVEELAFGVVAVDPEAAGAGVVAVCANIAVAVKSEARIRFFILFLLVGVDHLTNPSCALSKGIAITCAWESIIRISVMDA
jgi:hypothetical protein